MIKLVSIVYRPKDAENTPEHYVRVPLNEATLVADFGIDGDAKGGGERNLNIMSSDVMAQLATEGFITTPGTMGEQLIVEGVDVNALPTGTRLKIGDSTCVVLSIPRTGCGKFERSLGKPREEAAGRLGMMAQVELGGRITVGDTITVISSGA